MDLFQNLFKFPVVLADGDYEARKRDSDLFPNAQDEDMETVIGEAEVPYFGFVSVLTRWLPQAASRDKALQEGIFDACYVQFDSGSYLVPWTKERFKREYKQFVESLPKQEPSTTTNIKFMSKKDLKDVLKDIDDE